MSDLTDLADVYYDILAFIGNKVIVQKLSWLWSKTILELPYLKHNPKKEALDHGLRVDILAPTPNNSLLWQWLENI
jgi:uroporphyrinogen-III synthase